MYRLYSFINCYLSSIQQGIQTAHLVSELMADVPGITPFGRAMINDWAVHYKTIIVCNGGNTTSLLDYINLFNNKKNPYPWVVFNEDNDSLNGIMTGVAIILPEDIYDVDFDPQCSGWVSKSGISYASDIGFTYDLINMVKLAKLAC